LAAHDDRELVVVCLHNPVVRALVSVVEALFAKVKRDKKLVRERLVENVSVAGKALQLGAVVVAVGVRDYVRIVDLRQKP
jgi:hypothetical protein